MTGSLIRKFIQVQAAKYRRLLWIEPKQNKTKQKYWTVCVFTSSNLSQIKKKRKKEKKKRKKERIRTPPLARQQQTSSIFHDSWADLCSPVRSFHQRSEEEKAKMTSINLQVAQRRRLSPGVLTRIRHLFCSVAALWDMRRIKPTGLK